MDEQLKTPEQPNIPTKFNFDLKYQELIYNHLRMASMFRLERNQLGRFDALRGLKSLFISALHKTKQESLKKFQDPVYTLVLQLRGILFQFKGKIVYDPDSTDYVLLKSPSGSDYVHKDSGEVFQIPYNFQNIRLELDTIMDSWQEVMIEELIRIKLIFIKDKTGLDATSA